MKIVFVILLSAFFCTSAKADMWIDFLNELVSVSSDTKDVQGVNHVQDLVSDRLKKDGFTVRFIENPDPQIKSGKMLVAEWAGQTKRYFTLVTHADTVFEKLNPFVLSDGGFTAHGSGVIDNKGGIVLGIRVMEQYISELPKSKYSLRIIVSPSEETGSKGFASTLMELAKDSAFLFGLEPGLDNGNYVASRKGVRWYDIHVTGKESHAGAHHDEGVNACYDLSVKLSKMQELTDYKKGNTVSIGNISGGKDKFNIVCGEASAKVDTRFSTEENAKALFAKIEKVLKTAYGKSEKTNAGTETTFANPVDTPPLSENPKATKLMKKYTDVVSAIENRSIKGEATGGVADLNQMARPESLIADGMGPLGGGVHTEDEFLTVSSLKTRGMALVEFMSFLEKSLP